MTFYELCGMVRHCWRIALAIVLACTLGMGLYSLKGSAPVYKATATVVATDPSGKVTTAQLMATVEAIGITVERETSGDGVTITGAAATPTTSQCYILTAVSGDAKESITAANTAAHRIADEAKGVYVELAADGEERLHAYADILQLFEELGNDRIDAINSVVAPNTYAFCEFNVEEAQEASSQGSSLVKFLILGLVVGLLLSLCGIALYGFVKRPIKGRRDIEAVCDLPVLGGKRENSEVLWANVQFAAGSEPRSICVLSAGNENVRAVSEGLVRAVRATGRNASVEVPDGIHNAETGPCGAQQDAIVVYPCGSVTASAEALWCARQSDATVVCVRQWSDALERFAEVLDELRLAGSKVVGIIYFGN